MVKNGMEWSKKKTKYVREQRTKTVQIKITHKFI